MGEGGKIREICQLSLPVSVFPKMTKTGEDDVLVLNDADPTGKLT